MKIQHYLKSLDCTKHMHIVLRFIDLKKKTLLAALTLERPRVSYVQYLQACAAVPKPDLLASSSLPLPPGSLLK